MQNRTTFDKPKNKKLVTAIRTCDVIYYDENYKENDSDIECTIPINRSLTINDTPSEREICISV